VRNSGWPAVNSAGFFSPRVIRITARFSHFGPLHQKSR
jgi:hypothetical protein